MSVSSTKPLLGSLPSLRRLAVLFGLAVTAYLLSLQFIFPGYIALPAPFHNDMYWSLRYAANGWTFAFFLAWPRPVFYETLLLAGQFGLEGSLVFLTAIVLADLALAVFLTERFLIARSIPWWLAFGTMLFAMAGPGFYAQPAFDVGYHLALLFGLLGIWVWEARKKTWLALIAAGVCFSLSALANEAFVPAFLLYGAIAAWRARTTPPLAVGILCAAVTGAAVGFIDSQVTHSPFVALHADASNPYHIDVSASSLAQTVRFYFGSLRNWAFYLLFAVAIVGLHYNRRLLCAATIVVAALSLYLPYLILPNHLDDVYRWVPFPLLMLVIPLAWISTPGDARARFANVALIAVLAGTIVYQRTQYLDAKARYRAALEQNRAIIAALRSHRSQIARAHRILVRGLAFDIDPWAQNAGAVDAIVPFTGTWYVQTAPPHPAIREYPDAHAVPVGQVSERQYDLILDFDSNGNITRTRIK